MTEHFFWKIVADCVNPLMTLAVAMEILVRIPSGLKVRFLLRCIASLALSLLIVHLIRWLHLWPACPLFPSGHMTFYVALAASLFLRDKGSLVFTFPLGFFYAWLIVRLGFHSWIDLIGALAAGVGCVLLTGRITARQTVHSGSSITRHMIRGSFARSGRRYRQDSFPGNLPRDGSRH